MSFNLDMILIKLSNNEYVSYGAHVEMTFDVDVLTHASHDTVSRCGIDLFRSFCRGA